MPTRPSTSAARALALVLTGCGHAWLAAPAILAGPGAGSIVGAVASSPDTGAVLRERALALAAEVRSARELLTELGSLMELRRELERRREHALTLIFDEEEYFHPHLPPQCSPERARLYPLVQREVERRVEAVREVWDATLTVELPEHWRTRLAELTEIVPASALELDRDLELPGWIAGIDPTLERLGVRAVALDAAGRSALAYDSAVVAFNEATWSVAVESGAVSAVEAEQVRITNRYRRMLGRPALAFSLRIHAAARSHSEYMQQSGRLEHREPDPDRNDVVDRLRLAGYDAGATENLWSGRAHAMGAHLTWCSSSEHHRNLLDPGVHEVASGLAGEYWTQDLGRGTAFQGELDGWQH